MLNAKTIVPDTSVLIQGKLSEMIGKGELKKTKIIIPRAVIDELQAQASRGKEIGFEGLEEIKKIRKISKNKEIRIEFSGERPTLEEIQLAKKGRIDAIIKDVAAKEKALLVTGDYVQALVGEVEGVNVKHIENKEIKSKLRLEEFFTKDTQSVHLKVGVVPLAKRGKPGQIKLTKIRKKVCDEKELTSIINQILTKTRRDANSFIEMGKQGAMVVQLGEYRVSITRPPFSENIEVTAVRPIVKLGLDDYNLHEELQDRIVKGSQGVLIAGPPGSGKSTFAASIAEFLSSKGNIVKTFEQPRDLQVGPDITQYGPLEGDWEKTSELLLLVRPDYTIFDEVRKTRDFRIFADMRLAGVGMIGVVHSTNPVSAIQRMIGRIELGIIPHVVDTVIYISAGRIEKIFELSLTVKVPSGMKEQDLARPVVEIRNFETKDLEFEIYTYGEESVIVPVQEERSPLNELAKSAVYNVLRKYDPQAVVEVLSQDRVAVKVKNDVIARLIGSKGSNIEKLEEQLGVHISVEPREETFKREIKWRFEESGNTIQLIFGNEFTGKQVDVYEGERFLFSAFVGKGGKIKVKKNSELGRIVMRSISTNNLIVRL
jgi:ATPase